MGMFETVYLDTLEVSVRRIRGLGTPIPRRDVLVRAQRHGSNDRTRHYEGRVVDLEGIIRGASDLAVWQAFDSLKAKLALGSEHVLKFRRSGFSVDEQLTVIVAAAGDDDFSFDAPGVARWGVSLFAADPRIYSAVLKEQSYDPTSALLGGGVNFTLSFPLEFPTSTASHLELVNGGNFPSPPVLTIQGPVEDPSVDNDTTGETIDLRYIMGANDVIVVDVGAREITLNGAERPDLLRVQDSTWWELAAGTNQIRMRGTGMSPGVTELTVQYRDARI